MPAQLSVFFVLAAAICCGSIHAEMPKVYLRGEALAGRLAVSHVQTGGFAGLIESEVIIAADGSWQGQRKIGGRVSKAEGKLSADQLQALAAALAEHDLLGLPEAIGAKKPIKSPRNVADGASTTITLTFGERQVTANFADGVAVDEATTKVRQRLAKIEAAIRRATIDAPAK